MSYQYQILEPEVTEGEQLFKYLPNTIQLVLRAKTIKDLFFIDLEAFEPFGAKKFKNVHINSQSTNF